MRRTAIIVDDEPFIRSDLRHMLRNHPEIEVIGEAGNLPGARALLTDRTPDLLFLDVRLRGGSGFDLLPHVDPATRVVFLTAYGDYAVRAFEVRAMDYVLKPISAQRLAETLARLDPAPGVSSSENEEAGGPPPPFFDVAAVASIGGNYTAVHRVCGKKEIVRRTLKQWEILLPPARFLRIHRSAIVDVDRIERLETKPPGRRRVFVQGVVESFPVSRGAASRLARQASRKPGTP